MKLKTIYLLALAAFGFASCANEKTINNDEFGVKGIRVSLEGASQTLSKAAPGTTVPIVPDNQPGTVNDVEIYITDNAGIILRAVKVANPSAEWTLLTNGTGLEFYNVESSAKKVYVFGNLEASSLAVLGANISTVNLNKNLGQQQGTTDLLYLGKDENLTFDANLVANTEIQLSPVVSRFQITKISFETAGTTTVTKMVNGVSKSATVAWTGFNGDLKGIYLNNFFYENNNRTPSTLKSNTTSVNNILTGQWLFGATDHSDIASYSNYVTTDYVTLSLPTAGNCYAFNFFPESLNAITNIPKIHFYLDHLVKTTLTSTDHDVFNPGLFPNNATNVRYINVVGYKKQDNNPMLFSDFAANKLYNLEILIKPVFLQTDINHVEYDVICKITVLPWTVDTLIPEFEIN